MATYQQHYDLDRVLQSGYSEVRLLTTRLQRNQFRSYRLRNFFPRFRVGPEELVFRQNGSDLCLEEGSLSGHEIRVVQHVTPERMFRLHLLEVLGQKPGSKFDVNRSLAFKWRGSRGRAYERSIDDPKWLYGAMWRDIVEMVDAAEKLGTERGANLMQFGNNPEM